VSVLSPVLDQTPVTSIEEALARLTSIDQALPPVDGISCFNKLYLEVTKNVLAALKAVPFADPQFVTALDVAFANVYFAALRAYYAGSLATSRAWQPLFDDRGDRTIAPIQFAIAGMNAHINRDLPVALVATCEAAGVALEEGSPQHADFVRVNGVLAAVEAEVKAQYVPHRLHWLDFLVHRFHRLDDVVAMWDVARARDAAWTNAEALWALRHDRALAARFLDTLDRTVGLAGRGLLVRL